MAEISSGRSLKPNISTEPKLGYVLWLQGMKKTTGNAAGGKGLTCYDIKIGHTHLPVVSIRLT